MTNRHLCIFLRFLSYYNKERKKDMKNTEIKCTVTKTIITYDLSPCEISAEDIYNENSQLYTSISAENKGSFSLPNTTLATALNRQDAENAFREAVKKASSKNV